MKKVKYQEIYLYDYPENREFAKGLMPGDRDNIAKKTGLSYSYIAAIFKGQRRMPDEVREITKKIIESNHEKVAIAASL